MVGYEQRQERDLRFLFVVFCPVAIVLILRMIQTI